MKIAVLGSNGFLGSEVTSYLKNKELDVTGISRSNYLNNKNSYFDYFINCNGNSRKYWANNHPFQDFEKSVISVYHTIYDFKFDKYIYISSVDAFNINSIYGTHKRCAEEILQSLVGDNFITLRCGNIIGKNMQKGFIKDIVEGNKIYLTPNSNLRLITNTAVAKIIYDIVSQYQNFYHSTLCSLDCISIEKIGELLNKKINYASTLRTEKYIDIPWSIGLGLKSCATYLKEIACE